MFIPGCLIEFFIEIPCNCQTFLSFCCCSST